MAGTQMAPYGSSKSTTTSELIVKTRSAPGPLTRSGAWPSLEARCPNGARVPVDLPHGSTVATRSVPRLRVGASLTREETGVPFASPIKARSLIVPTVLRSPSTL